MSLQREGGWLWGSLTRQVTHPKGLEQDFELRLGHGRGGEGRNGKWYLPLERGGAFPNFVPKAFPEGRRSNLHKHKLEFNKVFFHIG